MLAFEEISVLDRNAQYLGVPTFKLMENAGKSVAETIINWFEKNNMNKTIAIFCGLGNNGGDGLVAARYLAYNHDYYVQVFILGNTSDIKSNLAREQLKRLPERLETIIINKNTLKNKKKLNLAPFSVIVDAMLGVGITGKLKEPYNSIVQLINSLKKSSGSKKKSKTSRLIISVDVPTGLGTATAVKPDMTVTFHDTKTGMTRKNSGEIIIQDIGIPPEADKYIGPGELLYIPKLKSSTHKGDGGRLVILGGGPYTGAPALAGLGALRTGIDLVHIATPERISNVISAFSPNFIVHPLGNGENYLTEPEINNIIDLVHEVSADAIIIGPGLGRAVSTKNAIVKVIERLPKELPIVLDADSFSALAQLKSNKLIQIMKAHTGVLTPHKGELKLLVKAINNEKLKIYNKILRKLEKPINELDLDLQNYLKEVTISLGNNWSILMKGPVDIITDGSKIKLNRTGNPGMTVGGTGDVLAGITGGLLAMGIEPFKAAQCSAFINGRAGDLCWREYRNGLLATDIIDKIPTVMMD